MMGDQTNQAVLRDLQRVLAGFASEIAQFCIRNDIKFYLMGGTALGAIRHGGFIPWDDDFDIFMDRNNYVRFLQLAEELLDQDKYYLQVEDTDEWPLFFSKVRLNQTLYVERKEDLGRMHCGVYIDVMCLHNVYNNKMLRYLQFIAARVLSTMALAKRGYKTTSTFKRLSLVIASLLGRTPIKFILLGFVRSLDYRETALVGHLFGRAPFRSTSFPRAFLGGGRIVPFGDTKFPVPNRVEEYLTIRFGCDYMAVPSDETRNIYPRHLISLDLGPYA